MSGITEDGCLVEWSSMKLAPLQGELRFKVQLTKVKDNETKTVSSYTLFIIPNISAKSIPR